MKKLIGFPQRGSKRHSLRENHLTRKRRLLKTLLSDFGDKKDREVASFKETDPRTCAGQADLGVCAQCTRVGCAEPRWASPWRKPFCNASNLARSREGTADSCHHSLHPPIPLGAGLVVVTGTLQEGTNKLQSNSQLHLQRPQPYSSCDSVSDNLLSSPGPRPAKISRRAAQPPISVPSAAKRRTHRHGARTGRPPGSRQSARGSGLG